MFSRLRLKFRSKNILNALSHSLSCLYIEVDNNFVIAFFNSCKNKAKLSFLRQIFLSHYFCEGGIENPVPQDHCLSPLDKPRDAKW